MGVDLSDLVAPRPIRLEDLAGKVVAIDAFNTLYQFLATIRQPDGTPLMDRRGRPTSHLSGVVYRMSNFVAAGIRSVFVFDGKPPGRKARTIEGRAEVKRRAERDWEEAVAVGDFERARTKAMQTSRLTDTMVEQSKRLLGLLGIPVVQAPSEGEAQASAMAARGEAYAVGSQDFDALLFGAPRVAQNLTLAGRRKLPRKNVFVDVVPSIVELEATLAALGVSREQLVDMAILIGTDFNEGVRGVGPKKAQKLLRENGSLERALEILGVDIEGYDEVRRIFLNPSVGPTGPLRFAEPDPDGVRAMLCDEFDFSRERIDAALAKFEEGRGHAKQRSLDLFSGPA